MLLGSCRQSFLFFPHRRKGRIPADGIINYETCLFGRVRYAQKIYIHLIHMKLVWFACVLYVYPLGTLFTSSLYIPILQRVISVSGNAPRAWSFPTRNVQKRGEIERRWWRRRRRFNTRSPPPSPLASCPHRYIERYVYIKVTSVELERQTSPQHRAHAAAQLDDVRIRDSWKWRASARVGGDRSKNTQQFRDIYDVVCHEKELSIYIIF